MFEHFVCLSKQVLCCFLNCLFLSLNEKQRGKSFCLFNWHQRDAHQWHLIHLANRYILGAVYENNLSCLYQEYAFTELKIEYLVFLWHFFVNRRKSEPHRLENLIGMNSPCNSAGSYFAWLFHETIFKNSISLKWRISGPKRVFKKFQSIGTDDKCVQSSELNNCILV